MRGALIGLVVAACGPGPRPDDAGGTGGDAPPADNECVTAGSSNAGCALVAVDLANAIDVFGPPVTGICDSYGADAKLLAPVAVCTLPDGTFAGRCDLDGTCASAPAGAVCEVHAACGLDAQHAPYAIVVANTAELAADVTLADAAGTTATVIVQPGMLATLDPAVLGFADHSVSAPGVTASAYRITATRPVVAYQLNPLSNVGVFSDDASLLLPDHVLGTSYLALSYPTMVRRPTSDDWHADVTLAAIRDTTVQVTPTTDVADGSGLTLHAGETRSYTLHALDTLHLVATGGDLTGTAVTADQPIAAFAGHEATVIADPFPFRNPCCADHLEDQLYPTTTWGKSFAIPRGVERVTQIHDYIRVMAQRPNTVVQVVPDLGALSTCTGKLLAPGQFCEVFPQQDIEVTTNEPVLVGHFMVSGGGISPESGDPSLAFVPPVEQFRTSYTFVVPDQYQANDVQLITKGGGTVMLDGADVSLLLATFGSGTWSAARITIPPGPHTLVCPEKCSVEVAGWAAAVSYLYSGGLDLVPIVQ